MLNVIFNTILRCNKYGLRKFNTISLSRIEFLSIAILLNIILSGCKPTWLSLAEPISDSIDVKIHGIPMEMVAKIKDSVVDFRVWSSNDTGGKWVNCLCKGATTDSMKPQNDSIIFNTVTNHDCNVIIDPPYKMQMSNRVIIERCPRYLFKAQRIDSLTLKFDTQTNSLRSDLYMIQDSTINNELFNRSIDVNSKSFVQINGIHYPGDFDNPCGGNSKEIYANSILVRAPIKLNDSLQEILDSETGISSRNIIKSIFKSNKHVNQ